MAHGRSRRCRVGYAPHMVKLVRTRSASPREQPEVRFRLRVHLADLIAIGPGKVDLLQAIEVHGSISAAARSLDMSYRRAWVLIDETNRAFSSPVVASGNGGQNGGGSTLTPMGLEVVRLYRAIEARATKACAPDISALLKLMAELPR